MMFGSDRRPRQPRRNKTIRYDHGNSRAVVFITSFSNMVQAVYPVTLPRPATTMVGSHLSSSQRDATGWIGTASTSFLTHQVQGGSHVLVPTSRDASRIGRTTLGWRVSSTAVTLQARMIRFTCVALHG